MYNSPMQLFPLLSSATPSDSSSSGTTPQNPTFWEQIQAFWNSICNFFASNIWNIVTWFAVLIFGALVIYIIVRFTRFIMRKRDVNEIAVRFIGLLIKILLWIFLILILLGMMGVPITALTTGLSAAILAVGIALKDFLSHLAAGIVLVFSRAYKEGNYIQVDGLEGSIVGINLLFTTLKTYDSTRVMVPNSKMVNSCVTNFEALGVRRVAIHFPIAHDTDLEQVRQILVDVMKSDGRVKLDPPPLCRLNAIKPDSLDMFLTCFVDIEDYWDIYFYIHDHGYDALKRAGIRIPHQQITVYEGREADQMPTKYEALPERVEKDRDDMKIKHLNLVDYDELTPEEVARIMAHNKKVREHQRAQKAKAKEAKEAKKKTEKTKK